MTDFDRQRRRLKKTERPTHDEVRDYQQSFYQGHVGITEDVLARTTAGSGTDSYRLLLDQLKSPRGKTILDLGCGSGLLTAMCGEAVGPEGRAVGSDFSADQIALAKQRIDRPNISFHCEDAGALHLEDRSVDFVVSHLALMLMTPVEPVVAEMARVIRPRGLLAAVVAAIDHTRLLYQTFSDILDRALRQETPHFKRLGDDRTYSVQGLDSLFNPNSGFEKDWLKHDYAVVFEDRPESLTPLIVRFFNSYHLLSQEGADKVRQEATEVFRRHRRDDGAVRFEVPLTLVAFTRTS